MPCCSRGRYLEGDCETTSQTASDWIVYQFAECVRTTPQPGQGSCAGHCDQETDYGDEYPYCHCDAKCSQYHDCCWDYLAQCVNDPDASGSGGDTGSGGGVVCAATCYGSSCDTWDVDLGMACDVVEAYGCNCAGCKCAGASPSACGTRMTSSRTPCVLCFIIKWTHALYKRTRPPLPGACVRASERAMKRA